MALSDNWDESLTVEKMLESLRSPEHLGSGFPIPPPPDPGLRGGLQIHSSPYLTKRTQIHFPRSKKRRIRKKWAKREENWVEEPSTDMYLIEGRTAVAHPAMEQKLKDASRRQQDEWEEKWG